MSDLRAPERRKRGVTTPAAAGAPRRLWPRLRAAVAAAWREEARFGHGFLWLPIAMASGAVLWFTFDRDLSVWLIAPLIVLAGLLVVVWQERPALRYVSLLICGMLIGMAAASVETARHDTTLMDSAVTTRLSGTVLARDLDHRGRWRYTIALDDTWDPQIRRPPETVRLLARSRHQPIAIGEGIAGLARLQPPSGPALPGSYDFAFNAYFNGLGAFGYFYGAPEQRPVTAERAARETLSLHLARLREWISHRVRAALPGDAGAFAAALTVADRRAMSPEAVEALRASGLAHVLAISGLHMALVAGTVFIAVRMGLSLFPRLAQAYPVKKWAAIAALGVATAYLLISGGSVSTQRAWLMLAIMLTAVLFDRPALTLRNVALAAIVILLLTPSAVLGPGFQMSFAATAALVAVYGWWRRRARPTDGTGRPTGGGFARLLVLFFVGLGVTSLVAGLATAPFATYHFHRVAAFGLIANLAAMPVVTFVVMPAGLLSVMAMSFGLEHWPLQVMGVGLDVVLAIARTVQGLGGHVVSGRMPDGVFLALTLGLLVLVLARSRLRVFGLPIIALALLSAAMLPGRGEPDLIISEDGRLVALVGSDWLATNRSRPSTFLFQQWQRALRRGAHVPPENQDADAVIRWVFDTRDVPGRLVFLCRKDVFCLGTTESGRRVAIVEDLALIGAACDRADIVITSRPIRMSACRSGAMLVTGRMLRQTGAVELYATEEENRLAVLTAIGDATRPWTAHRSYDWRTGQFLVDRPDWAVRRTASPNVAP